MNANEFDELFWRLVGIPKPTDEETAKFMATQKPPKPCPHGSGDDYCSWCGGSPPPPSKLEQKVLPVLMGEMFTTFGTGKPFTPSQALALLQQMVADEKAVNKDNAKPGQPRRSRKSEAKLAAAKAAGRLVPAGETTKEDLVASREDWIYRRGTAWGWQRYAAKAFGLDEKTIRSRMK